MKKNNDEKIKGIILTILIAAVGVIEIWRGRLLLGILCFVCAIIQFSQVPLDKRR